MGFGCNAAGVVGCRIISGKRERLIAILTNSFVPCNGRFPMLIALISLFLAGNSGGSAAGSLTAAGVLALVVVFSAAATLAVSFILSKTLLRGESSAFTLELPPYRVPRIGQVIVRSVLDRTLHVLGRAAAVAAPWGLAVYALANISAGGETLLSWFCSWLDPAARLIGLDGVILAAFILGLPANELVIPIMLMAYTSGAPYGNKLICRPFGSAFGQRVDGDDGCFRRAVHFDALAVQHNTADDKEGNGEYRLDCGGGGHTDGGGNRAACGAELHFRMRMPARFEILRMIIL